MKRYLFVLLCSVAINGSAQASIFKKKASGAEKYVQMVEAQRAAKACHRRTGKFAGVDREFAGYARSLAKGISSADMKYAKERLKFLPSMARAHLEAISISDGKIWCERYLRKARRSLY